MPFLLTPKIYLFLKIFIYSCVSRVYVCALCACLMPTEVKRDWDGSDRWLCATVWVLGIELPSSGREGPTINPLLLLLSHPPARTFAQMVHTYCSLALSPRSQL